ncbi:MAG: FkbM family methyltransferase [Candidatus Omnitrophota bacterium]|jgi:FkbM family methyltransferase|nr:MAG: FkbM family methyltransferase [Candidatus Omnitrophota bacterium]
MKRILIIFENIAHGLRRLPWLNRIRPHLRKLEPLHAAILKLAFKNKVVRIIDGIGHVYIHNRHKEFFLDPPLKEITWWKKIIDEVRPGDTVVDAGSYIGILAVLLAKKTGESGEVIAFEPNPVNFEVLKENIALNEVLNIVKPLNIALAANKSILRINKEFSESHIISHTENNSGASFTVESQAMDNIFTEKKIDILKIDTEGFEMDILLGAKNILLRESGYPRFIAIECHPYLWPNYGVDSHKLTAILKNAGYNIQIPSLPSGITLDNIDYSWIIYASKK